MDREDWEESEQEFRERAYVNLRDSIWLVVERQWDTIRALRKTRLWLGVIAILLLLQLLQQR